MAAPSALPLDAFKLHRTIPAGPTTESDIGRPTCITFYDGNILIGNTQGCVVQWRIDEKEVRAAASIGETKKLSVRQSLPTSITLSRGKKPVVQMEVVAAYNMLLTLQDGVMSAYDPRNMKKMEGKVNTKSASSFCVDAKAPHSLCICHKRKLMLYRVGSDGNYEHFKDLAIPETVLAMAWRGQSICVAYKKEYTLLGIEFGDVTDAPVPLEGGVPAIQLISERELLLSANNDLGIFINYKGEPVAKNPICWSKGPLKMTVCGHYLVAVLPNNTIEVISLLDQKVVQSIRFERGHSIWSDDSKVVVASEKEVATMFMTSLQDQVKQYLAGSYVEEALALLEKTRPSEEVLRNFYTEAGFVSFNDLQFKDAAKYFKKSNVDPREILAMFPDLRVTGFPYVPKVPHRNVLEICETERKAKASSERIKDKGIAMLSVNDLVRRARFCVADVLWARRTRPLPGLAMEDIELKVVVDTALLFLCVDHNEAKREEKAAAEANHPLLSSTIASSSTSSSTTSGSNVRGALAPGSPNPPQSTKDKDDDREPEKKGVVRALGAAGGAVLGAITSVIPGMGKGRNEDKNETLPERKHRDSEAPLPSFIANRDLGDLPYELKDLLIPVNACLLGDSESFLFGRKQYNTCAMLYQSRGQTEKALNVWAKMGSGEFKEANAVDMPSFGRQKSLTVVGPVQPAKLDRDQLNQALEANGVRQTVALLATQGDTPILWRFAEWVLKLAPREGLKIFTSSSRETPLAPDAVLSFLRTIVPQYDDHNKDDRDFDFGENYLEWLVQSERSREPRYHNQLALLYLRHVDTLLRDDDNKRADRARLPNKRAAPGTEAAPLGPARRKFYQFLQSSSFYNPSELLVHVLRTDLFEEIIVLYSKLNQHRDVLKTYIYKLRDHLGAADYCVTQVRRRQDAAAEKKANDMKADAAAADKSSTPSSSSSSSNGTRRTGDKDKQRALPSSPSTVSSHSSSNSGSGGGRHRHNDGSDDSDDDDDDDDDVIDEAAAERARQRTHRATISLTSDDSAAVVSGIRRASTLPSPSANNNNNNNNSTSNGSASGNGNGNGNNDEPDNEFIYLLEIYFSPEYRSMYTDVGPNMPRDTLSSSVSVIGPVVPRPSVASSSSTTGEKKSAIVIGAEPVRRAIQVLLSYSSFIDPVKAIRVIPSDVPLGYLAPYLQRIIPQTIHTHRDNQVQKSLSKANHLSSKLQLIAARSVCLPVKTTSRCVVCTKPLGDAFLSAHPTPRGVHRDSTDAEVKAFIPGDARLTDPQLPNYSVVHYRCAAKWKKRHRAKTKVAKEKVKSAAAAGLPKSATNKAQKLLGPGSGPVLPLSPINR